MEYQTGDRKNASFLVFSESHCFFSRVETEYLHMVAKLKKIIKSHISAYISVLH